MYPHLERILLESLGAGVSTVLVGVLGASVASILVPTRIPEACRSWNDNHVMEVSLFLTGVMTHLVYEVLGVNGR